VGSAHRGRHTRPGTSSASPQDMAKLAAAWGPLVTQWWPLVVALTSLLAFLVSVPEM